MDPAAIGGGQDGKNLRRSMFTEAIILREFYKSDVSCHTAARAKCVGI